MSQIPHHEHHLLGGNVRPTMEQLQAVSAEAALASMKLVRAYQLGYQETGSSWLKPADRTLVTQVDLLSEQAARGILLRGLPSVPVLGEEMGGDILGRDLINVVDPIDGTKPFVAGASTSSVIIGGYSTAESQTKAVTIGQPATGLLWQTTGSGAVKRLYDVETGTPLTEQIECRVWDGELCPSSIVFVDNSRGFVRGGRQIMDDRQVLNLTQLLQPSVDTQNYGSNGMHQALVANGGQYVTGSITTAMGGAWDSLGARLVIEAGGGAMGLSVNENCELEYMDPLDPFAYDILVTANNADSLAKLVTLVEKSWAA